MLPDFAIEELTIDPGRYDKAKDYFYFDTAFVTLVASDATIRTAYSFDIETPEAEASGMTKEKLDLGESDAVIQLEGKTWVIYPTGSKGPLLGGMKDPAYGVLIRQAGEDWPGGLPTKFVDQADGSVVVSVETWDSYRFSDDWNRIEATYVRSGTGWKVTTYKPIIESGNERRGLTHGVEVSRCCEPGPGWARSRPAEASRPPSTRVIAKAWSSRPTCTVRSPPAPTPRPRPARRSRRRRLRRPPRRYRRPPPARSSRACLRGRARTRRR